MLLPHKGKLSFKTDSEEDTTSNDFSCKVGNVEMYCLDSESNHSYKI